MQFALAAVLVGATPSPRESCPDTTQFGVLTVSPTTVKAGDTLTVNADLSCAIDTFDVIPEYTDYYIDVPDCGNESPIFLARRTFASDSTSESFTVEVPYAPYAAGASYVVALDTTYPVQGTADGTSYYVVGSVEVPITIIS